MKNYLKIKSFSLFKTSYVYVDVADNYQADQIFVREKLHVQFKKGEFRKDDSSYVIVCVKVSKKDTEKFEKCMELLANKMLLNGYNDYPEFCEQLMKMMEKEEDEA